MEFHFCDGIFISVIRCFISYCFNLSGDICPIFVWRSFASSNIWTCTRETLNNIVVNVFLPTTSYNFTLFPPVQ